MRKGVAGAVVSVAHLVVLLGTLLACMSSSELTAKGGDVEVSSSPPADHGYAPGACQSLGYIVGHGGGALGGWVSNDELVQYAMNDLRNKASERGANYIEHDAPQMGHSGEGTTTTVTVSGTAYACDTNLKKAVAAKPTATSAAQAKSGENVPPAVPDGAAGFKFGTAAADAERQCTAAGFSWSREQAQARCSGTPTSIGSPALAKLELCSDRVCGVELFAATGSTELVKLYDSVHHRLQEKYGAPRRAREPLSGACRQALEDCVASKAPAGSRWEWASGHSVELELVSINGAPVLHLRYRTNDRLTPDAPADSAL